MQFFSISFHCEEVLEIRECNLLKTLWKYAASEMRRIHNEEESRFTDTTNIIIGNKATGEIWLFGMSPTAKNIDEVTYWMDCKD